MKAYYFVCHSHNDELYICLTCDKRIKKNDVPCQAVAIKRGVEKLLIQFQTIHDFTVSTAHVRNIDGE